MSTQPFPDLPRWMTQCATCAELHARYRESDQASEPGRTLYAQETLADHLVAEHLGQLPGYVAGCSNCDEWQALAPHAEGTVWPLAYADLRHRAAHVFAPTLLDMPYEEEIGRFDGFSAPDDIVDAIRAAFDDEEDES